VSYYLVHGDRKEKTDSERIPHTGNNDRRRKELTSKGWVMRWTFIKRWDVRKKKSGQG